MKQILPLVAVFFFNFSLIYSQCPQINESSIDDCFHGVGPGGMIINEGICPGSGLTLHMTSDLISPIPMCNGGGVLNNPSYYAFVADGTAIFSVTVSPIPGSCSNAGGFVGIQGALVTVGGCDTGNSIGTCMTACTQAPFVLQSNMIPTAGTVMIIVLDGCNGSACDVNLNITSGWTNNPEPPDDEILSQSLLILEGDENCSFYTLAVEPPFAGICDYQWTFPDGSVVNTNSNRLQVDVSDFPDGVFCVQGFIEECFPGQLYPSENNVCYNYSAREYLRLEISSESTSCGKANGTALVEVSGQEPFSYDWSNGVTDSINVNITGGTYILSVTDGLGCIYVDSVIVFSTDLIESDIDLINPDCTGMLGIISLFSSGGSGEFSYQWNPDVSFNSVANDIEAGAYFITVTDLLDATCFEELFIELLLDDDLEINILEILPSSPTENTGSISLELNTGSEFGIELIGPHGFFRHDTITGNEISFSDLAFGLYVLNAEELLTGCSESIQFEIEVTTSNVEIYRKKNSLQIFPNPSTDVINLIMENVVSHYKIFTLDGSVVEAGELAENQINIHHLNHGVFILQVIDNMGQEYFAKIVKIEN